MGGASLAIGPTSSAKAASNCCWRLVARYEHDLAVGHRGGAFDRLLKTYEKVAAKKPAASARDANPAEEQEEAADAEGGSESRCQTRSGEAKVEPARSEGAEGVRPFLSCRESGHPAL